MTRLIPDTQAPELTIDLLGGGKFTLSEATPENFTLVVFYRGLHCPMCRKYLTNMNKLADDFAATGVDLLAVSMNDIATATQTKADWELDKLAIGYGLSEAAAEAWGLYISSAIREGEADVFCEPGLFLIRPDNRIFLLNVTNMPWGRPVLDELLEKIPFALERNYPARGVRS
ncbi:peroxiredoxin-like family protein [Marinovum sp. 2_MG-2023]|uniref:peroxiredoxin-like family protein n=1 Tax=Roseobacteraceae TaxID=2854170 RepID=UPI001FD0BB37|nr:MULTISPECIES: peroxiredoxin-like family protein [Roseobacteraceae]MCJ7874129.1 AhpC/TSA family protein [Phaeobacter sp. J2-8]MDO6730875.1 peroxiredoxin-like family protein [Marinovum sp. 2_MG-2023]MDO6780102.1 peroxiredoxin-like family protein [Marinovum sp. 1_MG-2023]